ncbi:MerR family transcriptional regulator [Streptomyces sp. NPDC049040]|uniref:MerR family transcriptional regulator n=1 Tax=Streptomyces sp. NPDC049040 TaxID=3365593 RepID=UPI0037144A0F
METKDLLPIGQFAQATGLSVTTLRHYDTAGVLPPAATDPATGYRYYARAQVGRAQLVRALRQLDVPVERIRVLLDRHAEGADIVPELDTRVRAAAQRVRGQHVVLRGLIAALTEGEGMSPDINLGRRGAIHALACRASVDAAGLDAFARSAYRTLYTEAGKGPLFLPVPAFIRYHGPMTDDSTTEVEACLPYEPEATVPGEPAAGVHLVHQQETPFASTVVEGEDAAWPRIQSAYDAVAAWISAHGFVFDGPAQEIHHRWGGAPGHPRNRIEVGWAVRDTTA